MNRDQPDITDLGNDVFQIDTRMAGYPGITAGYLIRGSRPCLVETGTATSAPVVRRALAALGVGTGDLASVVVTHIHLDHAGGAGDIAAAYPRAEIVVHQHGARHLADPRLLMAGAEMAFGDALDRLFGRLSPVPADRIRALDDTGVVDLGDGRRLDSHYSPGHARHHVGLIDSGSGDLYVGDAAGVYLPDTGDLRPATPPPEFDLDAALESLARFRALRPARLLFSHYGPVPDGPEILDRAAQEITAWVEGTRRARRLGVDLDHAVAMVREQTRARYGAFADGTDPAVAEKAEVMSRAEVNVGGIWHWLRTAEPLDAVRDEDPAGGRGGRLDGRSGRFGGIRRAAAGWLISVVRTSGNPPRGVTAGDVGGATEGAEWDIRRQASACCSAGRPPNTRCPPRRHWPSSAGSAAASSAPSPSGSAGTAAGCCCPPTRSPAP